MKRILFIPLILYSSLSLSQGILKGQILDFDTRQPIPNALVSFRNFPSLDTLIRSDEKGNYSFQGPQANYSIKVRKATYREQELLIFIEGQKTKELIITLKKKIELDALSRNEVVQTPTRMPLSAEDHNASISVLRREDLFTQNPRTLAEALMVLEGTWIERPYHGGASARIRGLSANQALVLVDGVRLNHGALGSQPNNLLNTLDPFMVDRVEVLRGSGGSAYGSDALGGVLHVFSQNPVFSTDGRLRARLNGLLKYGGGMGEGGWQSLEQSSRAQLSVEGERVATIMGLTVKDFGPHLAGDSLGLQEPSAYLEVDIDFKSCLKIGKKNLLTLAYQRVSLDSARWYSKAGPTGEFDFFQTDPLRRSLGYMRIERENNHSLSKKLTLTASYQTFLEEVDSRVGLADGQGREIENVESSGFSLVNHSPSQKAWTHSTGLEVYLDRFSSELRVLPDSSDDEFIFNGTLPELASSLRTGGFTIHTLKRDKFLLNAGLRYDFIQNYGFDDFFGDLEDNSHGLSAHSSLSYEFLKGQRIIARAHSDFRAPNIGDWRNLGSLDDRFEVPNQNLLPERSLGLEGGYRISTKYLQLKLAAFYTALTDLIVSAPGRYEGDSLVNGQRVFMRSNLENAVYMGLEGDFLWNVLPDGPWFLAGNLTLLGEGSEGEMPLRRLPPAKGRLKAHYQKGNLMLGLIWMGVASQDRLSLEDLGDPNVPSGGTAGWSVYHAFARYDFVWGSLSLRAENLSDRAYRVHGSGHDGYGRSIWASFRVFL